ncbi:hypothetical protein BCR34DRAFT_568008 [Clohesyomyces aquaticus]|uniref:Uncharacterized protein n=1 Tax=Clohesyomyces aquaticus TaxID=1231657 RepID=A0A1Y1ZHK2_9PLEO|nr:hypothetical protein BCR34DRAFT_568008 [Clohesyomyces aquaticus]
MQHISRLFVAPSASKSGAEFPQSQDEARRHIDSIREEKLAATNNSIARALNAVLKESAHLYSDSAHFLFELIQNADDNEYEEAHIPTLKFTYRETFRKRHLRIDCNEVGFRRSDVESICSLSESSKSRKDVRGEHIGEKGWGFKSVFAVADVVWILSGHYSFKFAHDNSQTLGMIVPLWDRFPQKILPGNTSILLELTPGKPVEPLLDSLRSMDPAFLMFLRRVREIDIDIRNSTRLILRTRRKVLDRSEFECLDAYRGKEYTEYVIFRRMVSGLPRDTRRKGITQTGLVLAFPTGGSSPSKDWSSQSVHAFLPIRDYGYPFALHADFIVVGSREDIDPSPWNTAILDGVPNAFLGAVERFNLAGGDLRYHWLRFIPSQYTFGIFRNASLKILALLRQSPILESQSGTMLVPSELTYIPKKFRDSKSRPFVPSNNSLFISRGYPVEYENFLDLLGVKKISEDTFLEDIAVYITTNARHFQNQPHSWHSELSGVLTSMINRNFSHKTMIAKWEILPLRDGRWISSETGSILWPASFHMPSVPGGIDVLELQTKVKEDPFRAALATSLGAKNYDEREICDAIVRTHMDPDLQPGTVTDEDLISHISFLMRADWRPRAFQKNIPNLWFVADNGSRHRGTVIYIDSEQPHAATKIFRDRDRFYFLDKRYSKALSGINQHWQLWLSEQLQLTILPRLVMVEQAAGRTFTLSDDIKYIIQQGSPLVLLLLLREWWPHYEKWIVEKQGAYIGVDKISVEKLRALISSLTVPCRGGSTARLSETVLPRTEILLACGFLKNSAVVEAISGDFFHTTTHPSPLSKTVESQAWYFVDSATQEYRDLPSSAASPKGNFASMLQGGLSGSLENLKLALQIVRVFLKPTTELIRLTPWNEFNTEKILYLALYIFILVLQIFTASVVGIAITIISCWGLHLMGSFDLPGPRAIDEAGSNLDESGHLQHRWCTETVLPDGQRTMEDPRMHENSKTQVRSSDDYLFLDVPDPNDEKWDFLKHFGVILSMDHQAFLDRLREASRGSPDKAYVDKLYEQLERCDSRAQRDQIRATFREEKVVYIPHQPGQSNDRWVSLGECVWEGPPCLTAIPCLKRIYPDRAIFFQSTLRCTNADMETLIEETKRFTTSDALEYIAEVLKEISFRLKDCHSSSSEFAIADLMESPIFPTKTNLGQSGFMTLQTASTDDEWYIPDRNLLGELLESQMPLLALDSKTIEAIHPLVRALGIGKRFLSKAATKGAAPTGIRPNPKLTRWLQGRMAYIGALVPFASEARKRLSRLRKIEVFQVEEVVITWSIHRNESKTVICTEVGQAVVTRTKHRLNCYIVDHVLQGVNPFYELVAEIAHMFDIQERHTGLLSLILMERKISIVEHYLKRDGFQVEQSGSYDDPLSDTSSGDDESYQKKPIPVVRLKPLFTEMRNGVIMLSPPWTNFGKASEDMDFVGQLFISKLLERVLKEEYRGNDHWTNPLRTRAGYRALRSSTYSSPTFSFLDRSGRFATFLSGQGHQISQFDSRCTFYVDVYTDKDSTSGFDLNRHTAQRVQKFTTVGNSRHRAKDISIIARVLDVYGEAKILLHVDPWQQYVNKKLLLEPLAGYWASFEHNAPTVRAPIYEDEETGLVNIYQERMNPSSEIRLLEIYPDTPAGPLKGKLHQVPIDQPGKYWALSYVWGYVPSNRAPIYFETDRGKILITASLESALRRVRKDASPLRIWVDALCINQSNPLEKSLQIQLMDRIYHTASRVVAWLGTEEDDSRKAMEFLQRISEPQNGSPLSRSPNQYDQIWRAINTLLERTWFARVWIVQELVYGSEVVVICGDVELTWDNFFVALERCGEHMKQAILVSEIKALLPAAGPAFALGKTRRHLQQERRKLSFLELMDLFSYTDATMERDKLFALRGLAHDMGSAVFNPAYSTSREEAIRQYAIGFVQTNRALDLLYRAGTSKSYSFSSWIPYWTRKAFPHTISNWESEGDEFYAGLRISPEAKVQESNPEILEVKGFLLDTLISTARIRLGSERGITFVDAMADFETAIHNMGKAGYPTGETANQLRLRIPIGNARGPQLKSLKARYPDPASTHTAEAKRWPANLEHCVFSVHRDQDAALYEAKPRHVQEVISQYWQTAAVFSERLSGAKFAVTRNGYAGLVPEDAQVGDQICLFHGGRVPFLVRDDGETSKLVGECYVHGIMHGESLAEDSKLKIVERNFSFR